MENQEPVNEIIQQEQIQVEQDIPSQEEIIDFAEPVDISSKINDAFYEKLVFLSFYN